MKTKLVYALFVFLSVACVFGRFLVPGRTTFDPSLSYEACAHVYVGVLFGLWLGGRGRAFLWVAIALTAFETVMFLMGKFA